MVDYRKRCYEVFVSKHWKNIHKLSKKEYELYSKTRRMLFKNILPCDKSARILDVACGAGLFLYFLKKEGYNNVRGIDLSEEQINVARKAGIENIEQADLFNYLPNNPNVFDLIIANDIIEHLRKDEIISFLDLVYASLKTGGKAIVSTPNVSSLFGAGLAYIDFTHETGFTPESISQVMGICNFTDIKIYGEGPVNHDFKSSIRVFLWSIAKIIQKCYLLLERGTGRDCWNQYYIFEPRMFAVGIKK